jgi:hypothetical protein
LGSSKRSRLRCGSCLNAPRLSSTCVGVRGLAIFYLAGGFGGSGQGLAYEVTPQLRQVIPYGYGLSRTHQNARHQWPKKRQKK